jgi:hypothetical protein
MERRYKIGEKVLLNSDNEIIDAEVFAYINLDLGRKTAYSLRVGKRFFFVDEDNIIPVENV